MTPFRRRFALRAVTAILAATALVGGLAACSGGSTATAAADIPAEGTDDGSTLTLWTRAPLEKQAKDLVAAYNASHKNQVELTVVPNDDYVAKVGAAAGSGGLPDLFAADIVYVPNWVEQGLFQDISAQIDGLSYKDTINQGHLDAGTLDGKEHVLPFVLDLSVMMWNKSLVAEAGLDPEKAPATVADFAKTAKAVQALNKPGVSGTSTGLNCGGCLLFTWFPSIWASGEEVLSADGTKSLLNNDAAKKVYSTWKDLDAAGAVAPGSADETGATWVAGFQEGKVGIMPFPPRCCRACRSTRACRASRASTAVSRPSSAATASASRRTPRRRRRRGTSCPGSPRRTLRWAFSPRTAAPSAAPTSPPTSTRRRTPARWPSTRSPARARRRWR